MGFLIIIIQSNCIGIDWSRNPLVYTTDERRGVMKFYSGVAIR